MGRERARRICFTTGLQLLNRCTQSDWLPIREPRQQRAEAVTQRHRNQTAAKDCSWPRKGDPDEDKLHMDRAHLKGAHGKLEHPGVEGGSEGEECEEEDQNRAS